MNPLRNLIYKGLEYYGMFYSSYRGFVIDNQDPENLSRLRLYVPGVHSKPTDSKYWAYPKHNFSGVGYGAQAIPQVNDMVYVEFEQGDPSKPIWQYGHFGYKEKNGVKTYEKPSHLSGIKKFWFRTPNKHTLLIDDESNEVSVTHGSGNSKVVVAESKIALTSGNAQAVIEDNSKITLSLGDSVSITLDGSKITLHKGSTSIELSDSSIVNLATSISLGTNPVSSNPAVLGNYNFSALLDLAQALNTLNTAIIAYCATQSAAVTPVIPPAQAGYTALSAAATNAIAAINSALSNIPLTNSSKVTLD